MRIPTKEEINPIAEDLDGQWAVGHYLGKSLEEAEALFVENDTYYAGDLVHMGAVAFTFYFKAALAYLMGRESEGAADFVRTVIWTLEWRLLGEYNDFPAIKHGAPDYREFCGYVLRFYDKFEFDEDIDGDIRSRITPIQQKLKTDQDAEGNAGEAV